MDSDDQVVELAITKERLRYADEKNSQQEDGLRQAHVTIGKLEERLRQVTEDFHTMKVTLEVTRQKLTHAEQALNQRSQNTTGRDRQTKWRALFASILFAIASVLTGVGGNQIASTPPNSFGDFLIGLGILVVIVAAILTTLLT